MVAWFRQRVAVSIRKLERFMRVRLVLRHLQICFLHFPLAQLPRLGISRRLWGLLGILCAGRLFGREFYGTVLRMFSLCTNIWFVNISATRDSVRTTMSAV